MKFANKKARLIVHIDEDKCNGCGECVPSCAEGAIQIIDGKARLIAEKLCDGLGACLGVCPLDAIRLEERPADPFNEEAVDEHLEQLGEEPPRAAVVCPGMAPARGAAPAGGTATTGNGRLANWPIQLALVNPRAPSLAGASLLIAADCTAFAGSALQSLINGRVTLIGCPKLDDAGAYMDKLAAIMRHNDIADIRVAIMEVPCCAGMTRILEMAQDRAGTSVPVNTSVLGLDGEMTHG